MIFDELICEKYCRMLIDHDEVERALLILENIPSYYRDNPPKNLVKLKEDIHQSLLTTHAYMTSALDSEVSKEKGLGFVENVPRGVMIKNEVQKYNEKDIVPHIVEMGPGEYGVLIGLSELGFRFTYDAISIDPIARNAAKEWLLKHAVSSDPKETIFIANEIIEHLPSTRDIVIEAMRHCGRMPERVHLSTPYYSYDVSDKQWEHTCGLPHLRAYTPGEFIAEAKNLFPNYTFQFYDSPIMSIRGCRSDCVDSNPLY